jgi:hypothetical protein
MKKWLGTAEKVEIKTEVINTYVCVRGPNGVDQKALMEKTGWSQSKVSKIVSGKYRDLKKEEAALLPYPLPVSEEFYRILNYKECTPLSAPMLSRASNVALRTCENVVAGKAILDLRRFRRIVQAMCGRDPA